MATQQIWSADTRPTARYTTVAIILHWAIAAMIIFNLASGLLHAFLPGGVIAVHISSGVTILALTVVRIVWRLTHRPPPLRSDLKPWERYLAHGVHLLLYAGMLVLPLSGWAMISANPPPGSPGAAAAAAMRAPPPPKAAKALPDANKPTPPSRSRPVLIWGIVPLPKIAPLQEMGRTPEGLPAQKEKHEQIETVHGLGGYILLLLLVLHIAGALKHQLIDRHRELARMGLGTPERVV